MIRVGKFVEFDEAPAIDRADPAFLVDIEGFEGPLDLLLELAQRQKVDLHTISISALAEQYLGFIELARSMRLELAADYLVMAAWLAYLKSRLLIPGPPPSDEPDAADLAAALVVRLARLETIRQAAALLLERPRLGRDFFTRGAPDAMGASPVSRWQASLHDLLSAYARQRQTLAISRVTLRRRAVWSIAQARSALEDIAGQLPDWSALEPYLAAHFTPPGMRRTVRASIFSAALEMVREGEIDLRQDGAFSPLWLRRAGPGLCLAARI